MGYYVPKSLQEALDALAGSAHSVVAGGTDFFPAIQDNRTPTGILDVSGIPEMRGISRQADGWRIGAATRWCDVTKANLPPCFDALKSAAREVGSPQIQNVATIGGNLCNASPAADGVPPLLVLDAQLELSSSRGVRTLALSDFITGVRKVDQRPEELLTSLFIPDLPGDAHSSFLKLGSRRYLLISISMVAALIWPDDTGRIAGVRIAVGACSPVARRLPALEADLTGRNIDDLSRAWKVTDDHLAPLSPIADVRGSAAYRWAAVKELCQRAVCAAAVPPEGTSNG